MITDRDDLEFNFKLNHKDSGVQDNSSLIWNKSEGLVGYPEAIEYMKSYVHKIAEDSAPEMVWLLEHPALYTAGTSAKQEDLLDKEILPVYEVGRGGQYTYHGPGQRVVYIMLDLRKRYKDVRRFVACIEQWIINSLADLGVCAMRRDDRVGVWVINDNIEEKIASIGIRLHKWVSYHGLAINFAPNLEHFKGIVPCGQKDYGVTSLKKMGNKYSMNDLDESLKINFEKIFGDIV